MNWEFKMVHQPVLIKEVLKYLEPKTGEKYIDCTAGLGGHTIAIAQKIVPDGKILGIEKDSQAFEKLKSQVSASGFGENIVLAEGSFTNLKELAEKNNFNEVSGILFDLGISSWQIEKSGRGFSFLRDEPLDMRFSGEGIKAEDIVNKWPQEELARIFKGYGEERYAVKVARAICRERKQAGIKKTNQLVEIIRKAVPGEYRHRRIHFATKTFQALRMAVNNELAIIKKALPQTLKILKPKGKVVIISFHSLEDRIAKNFIRQNKNEGQLEIITKKPIRPAEEEIFLNFRSRSAKLRVGKKI